MEKKINIAELLKDCPSGMELDCTMYENVYFNKIYDEDCLYQIGCYTINDGVRNSINFTKYGEFNTMRIAKCVIFPKGKTTWEGFEPPCKFEDGDIIFTHIENYNFISIFKQFSKDKCYTYIDLNIDNNDFFIAMLLCYIKEINIQRLATEEEKQKLFDAIKANGYKWNEETKTLEKLIEKPNFKVGDRIRKKGENSTFPITDVNEAHYFCGKYVICDTCDNDWELVPNKFDITTLKPFESRVLVRGDICSFWKPAIFGFIKDKIFYILGGAAYEQCIPYKNNEHLLGTKNNCDEYYKTWE